MDFFLCNSMGREGAVDETQKKSSFHGRGFPCSRAATAEEDFFFDVVFFLSICTARDTGCICVRIASKKCPLITAFPFSFSSRSKMRSSPRILCCRKSSISRHVFSLCHPLSVLSHQSPSFKTTRLLPKRQVS